MRIEMEAAAAGIGDLSGGREDLEISESLDGEVERVSGLLEVALRLQNLSGGGAGSEPNLHAGGDSLLGGGSAGRDHVLVDEILKLDAAFAESGSIGIGEIVGNVVQIGLLRGHATGGGIERTKHGGSYNLGQIFGCGLVELVVKGGERALHHFRIALDFNQADGALDGIDVGALKRTLADGELARSGFL